MFSGAAFLLAITLLGEPSYVDAHGSLFEPKPTFMDGKPTVGWITMIDNYWDIGSGGDQAGKFNTMAKEKGMSVKDVVLDMVKNEKCGYTRTDVDPQPVPMNGKAIWKGSEGVGFTHQGPCELYIDDKIVFHSDNCEDEYPGGDPKSDKMSEMPVELLVVQWQLHVHDLLGDGSANQTETKTSTAASTQGSQTSSQSTETSTKQGSPTTEAPSSEQQSNQTPSTEQKATEAPSSEQQSNTTPSSEQQNQTPSTEQKTTQAPSSEQQWTPAPQPPSTQQDQQKQQEEQQKKQDQQQQQQDQQKQQQSTQAPSTEQRSLDFKNLNGGTGTVQPPTNLRK